jgi:hypothetical protein
MRTDVTGLYVSLFGRAPESGGLGYWVSQLDAGKTLAQVAQEMYNVDAARVMYPAFATNQEIVSKFYSNVLGRTADADGLAYWTGKLNSGETKGQLITEMITAVKSYSGSDTAALASQALFNNKVTVGLYFAVDFGSNDIAKAATALSLVTSDAASVAAAEAAIAGTGGNGASFTLTNGTDVATATAFTAGLVYTPGGDDRINSLQDEDILTGADSSSHLDATLGNSNDNGATVITPKLINIPTVNVAFTGSGGGAVTDLDVQDATGLTTVNITRVSQAVNVGRIENIKQVLSTMSIANTNANNAGVVEFSFAGTTLQGATTGTLNLSDVQIGTVNIGGNSSGVGASGVGNVGATANNTGYENLTINSTGSSNSIGSLNLPMDTGTAGKVTITGDKNLTLAAVTNIINAANNTVESQNYAGGILQVGGRLSSIDASALTGTLTLNIAAGTFTTGKADTSGQTQDVSILGGAGDDTFYLGDTIQAGDSLNGGGGTDNLIVVNGGNILSSSSIVGKVEKLSVFLNGAAPAPGAQTLAIDFDKLPDVTNVLVRNISNNSAQAIPANTPAAGTDTFTLNNLTAGQATGISIQHSNTGSNGITQSIINANLKVASGTNDTVAVTISEGLNTDPRFNFTLNAINTTGVTANNVENITLIDADSESNTVALGGVAQHTGTVTIGTAAGAGKAGTFLNLDTTTTGGNGGMYQYSVTGSDDAAVGGVVPPAGVGRAQIIDLSGTATQDRIVAATVDASAETSNIIVRVASNAASVVGAQTIKMGAGNDTVIFDNLNDTRAGLTISDTVTGGAGDDTLVIDGNLTVPGALTLSASEWTNVSGFETIRLVNPGAGSTYALTLTDALITANNKSGILAIVNDHDTVNDTGRTTAASLAAAVATNLGGNDNWNGAGQTEAAVVIDARTLSATSKFSYNGEEGTSRTNDRIIMSDANINGGTVIDGGAIDNLNDNRGIATATLPGNGIIANQGNLDVIEVRNAAVVSQGDLDNVSNIGTLQFTNDTSVTQVSTLQLNDTIVDRMVDSFQASVSRGAGTGQNVEVLNVSAFDNLNVAAATTGLTIEAGTLTDKSDLNVVLGRGLNTVATGAGQDRVVLLGNYVAGTYANTVVENGIAGTPTAVVINAQSTATAVARVATDNINLGGGVDTLVTYGAINLAGATLTGVESISANSALVLTASQYNALVAARALLSLSGPVITFEGNTTHQLTIIDDIAGANAIDLTKIQLNGGNLVYDITSSSNATGGGVNNMTSTGAVVDNSTTGDPSVGVVGTTPTNNAANTTTTLAAGGTYTGTAGVNDIFASTTANLVGTTVTGTAADTEQLNILDAAGAVSATVTNIDIVKLFDGSGNNLSFAGIINGATNVVSVIGGTGDDAVTLGAVGVAAGQTGAASSVSLGNGNDTVNLEGTRTGTFDGGLGTDILNLTSATNLAGATLTSFETLTGNQTLSVTAAQYAGFNTMTDSAAITLTTAGAVTLQSGAPVLVLANGTNTVGATATANFNITGGTGADTVSFGSALTANDTFAAGTGSDVVTLTGSGTGSANITGVETIQLNFASAGTFTTGAIAPGVASTITAAGSTAAVTLDASAYVATTSVTFVDGAGNDSLTVGGGSDAQRALTTVSLATGGADTVTLANGAFNGTTTNSATINSFGTTAGANQDKIAGLGITTYQTVSAAATGVTAANSVVEVHQAAGLASAFDAGNGGVVEATLQSALTTYGGADGTSFYAVVYGTGAQSGNAALYQVNVTTAATGITTANVAVELVGVFNGVTADSFVSSNFL